MTYGNEGAVALKDSLEGLGKREMYDLRSLRFLGTARCSVRIRNFTNNIALGGIVRVLRATTGRTMVPGLYSDAELDDLCDGIRNHALTCVLTGQSFAKDGGMQKNAIIVDQTCSLHF